MKCISLWQPWASLMVIGAKRNETRSWPTKHRGVLAIHASKMWSGTLRAISLTEPHLSALKNAGAFTIGSITESLLPLGCILGVVEVVDCVLITRANTPTGDEFKFGDYTPGRFMWQCRNAIRFAEPIPYRGAQGLFDVPDALILPAIERARAAA